MVYTTLNRTRKQVSSPSADPTEPPSSTATGKSFQPTIVEAVEKRAPLQPGQKRTEEITDAITYYLAKDTVAFVCFLHAPVLTGRALRYCKLSFHICFNFDIQYRRYY